MALAIGGNDGEEHQAGMDGVFTLPEVGPRLRDEDFVLRAVRDGSSGDSGRESRRLIFPGIASDGTPEPEVIASAVSDTVAIPDENPGADSLIVPPAVKADVTPAPTDWTGDIPALIASYDWPDNVALAIAWCESTHQADAYNSQPVFLNGVEHHAIGVFQTLWPLHAWRYEGDSPYDPVANVRVAYGMWLESGWNPWKECW